VVDSHEFFGKMDGRNVRKKLWESKEVAVSDMLKERVNERFEPRPLVLVNSEQPGHRGIGEARASLRMVIARTDTFRRNVWMRAGTGQRGAYNVSVLMIKLSKQESTKANVKSSTSVTIISYMNTNKVKQKTKKQKNKKTKKRTTTKNDGERCTVNGRHGKWQMLEILGSHYSYHISLIARDQLFEHPCEVLGRRLQARPAPRLPPLPRATAHHRRACRHSSDLPQGATHVKQSTI
jgi:hypothetical protein